MDKTKHPISDEDLLLHYKNGFIAGPKENWDYFLMRIKFCTHIGTLPSLDKYIDEKLIFTHGKVEKKNWEKASLRVYNIFGMDPDWISAYYSSPSIFVAGSTLIFETEKTKTSFPVVVVKNRWFSLTESLSHEAVHAIRAAFNETKYEEFFAYHTSNYSFRRLFGPIVKNTKEAIYTTLLLILGSWSYILFDLYIPLVAAFSLFSFGLFRLALSRYKICTLYASLNSKLKDKRKVMSLLICLTDTEIDLFSSMSLSDIIYTISERRNMSPRWRLIYLIMMTL